MADNTQKIKNIIAALEALLFVYGEPMSISRIAKLLGVGEEEIKDSASALAKKYDDAESGLFIIELDGKYQLVTKPEFGLLAQEIIQEEMNEELTGASVETLSLIAYGGPISRPQIDFIRGVNSSFIVRSLLMRGLIDRKPDERRHNLFMYSVSFDFLKKLGIGSFADLPNYDSNRVYIENFLNSLANNEPKD